MLDTRTIGRLRVHAIQAGGQQLDGGAMFGVVPKTLWSRRIEADAKNRIPLGMRCLLIEHEDGLVLLDTGSGNKETPKFHDIYAIENRGAEGRTALEDGIRAAGFAPDDVKLVINTHLHVDHVGWNTQRQGEQWVPTFPRARYIWGAREWAHWGAQGQGGAMLPENLPVIADSVQPVVDAGLSEMADDISTVLPGLSLQSLPGHTAGQMMVVLDDGHQCAVFPGDALHQPMQVYQPGWNSRFCEDAQTARQSRQRLRPWLSVFAATTAAATAEDAAGAGQRCSACMRQGKLLTS
jgi:glyoxylase-like metal-dependent hydrolase (beta-lactamase superfamily II)